MARIFCIICLHCLFQLIRKPVQVRLPRINSHNDLTYESLVPSTERHAMQGCACCTSLAYVRESDRQGEY